MWTAPVLALLHAGPAHGQESASNSPATGVPAITGTVQVGETLTADISGITDSDGVQDAEFSYSWLAYDGGTEYLRQVSVSSTYEVPTIMLN